MHRAVRILLIILRLVYCPPAYLGQFSYNRNLTYQGLMDDDSGQQVLKEGKMTSQTDQSPVTGIIDEATVIIDFGTYEGKTVSEIFEVDRDFYDKLTNIRETGNFSIRRNNDKTFRLYVNPLVTF